MITKNKESYYAALDLGTNNCRLLIAEPRFRQTTTGRALCAVDGFSRIVRLGEGLSASGRLSEEAMERTLAALQACRDKLDRHQVVRSRYVATEACRRAGNALEFIQRIRRDTGLSVEIISSEEEARLALLGCCSLLRKRTKKAIAFDIGGGSTEIMWVEAERRRRTEGAPPRDDVLPFHLTIKDWISVPYGVMNLSERFGNHAYTDMYFEDIVRRMEEALRPFDARHDIARHIGGRDVQMLSTSGTVTTLAAVHLNLPRYERNRIDGLRMPLAAMQHSVEGLLAMRPSQRFHHPCIGPDRNDFILAGCAIVTAILRVWPFSDLTIADRGVREGIIVNMLLDKQE